MADGSGLKNFPKRALFVAWAAPLGYLLVNCPFSIVPASFGTIVPAQVVILILTIAACAEYMRMLSISFPVNGFWLAYIWLGFEMLVRIFEIKDTLPPYLGIFLLLVTVAAEAIIWGRSSPQRRWSRSSLLFSGVMFMYIAGFSLLNLYEPTFQNSFVKFTAFLGSQLGVVTVLSAVFLCDSAAYFVGSAWGKHHFSKISPKKTIEGTAAGILTATIVGGIGFWFCAVPEYPRWLGIIMGLVIGISAILGDILESTIKRYFSVKDASDVIPGHGGVLDRFDSLFFTAPILNIFFWIIHRIF